MLKLLKILENVARLSDKHNLVLSSGLETQGALSVNYIYGLLITEKIGYLEVTLRHI